MRRYPITAGPGPAGRPVGPLDNLPPRASPRRLSAVGGLGLDKYLEIGNNSSSCEDDTARQQILLPFEAAGRGDPAHAPRTARRRLPGELPLPLACLVVPVPGAADERERARVDLELRIAAHLPGGRLSLTITDNRYTMISVKRGGGAFRLRLHHMFLGAELALVQALARYVSANDAAASRVLSDFIDSNQKMIKAGQARRRVPAAIEPRGEIHDLRPIFDELNATYFDGKIDARITWGLRSLLRRRPRWHRSIKMGSYSVEDRLIRIHPSLDRPFVPRLFVASVVFHEMLHQKHDIPTVAGRRRYHTPAFYEDEARLAWYDAARRWEHENLDRILVF